jgi:NitT/TauT family transport system substrate-binding protein
VRGWIALSQTRRQSIGRSALNVSGFAGGTRRVRDNAIHHVLTLRADPIVSTASARDAGENQKFELMRRALLLLITLPAVLATSGCGPPAPAPPFLSLEEATAEVQHSLPASRYVTNDLLSGEPASFPAGELTKLRIGMPWVLNDEIAPWFIGQEKGFYRDEGLEVELSPGGPGIDPLQLLVGGKLDIAVPPAGVQLVELIASPTGADLAAIGAVLKGSPYCWLGIDKTVPADQPSHRRLRPTDFIGHTIGLQAGSDFVLDFIVNTYKLPRDELHIKRVGFTPDPLLAGTVDYYAAFIVNQPRIIERAGHRNWMAFRFDDWGWVDFGDVSVVRRETLQKSPDVLRRYLRATSRALRFMLDQPGEAAEITARRSVDVPLTPEMVRRRFDLQSALIQGPTGSPLQEMMPDRWDLLAAHLVQSGTIHLPAVTKPRP